MEAVRCRLNMNDIAQEFRPFEISHRSFAFDVALVSLVVGHCTIGCAERSLHAIAA